MKDFSRTKTIQLIITLVVMAAAALIALLDRDLFQMIGSDPNVRLMALLFWVLAGASLVFLFIDFRVDAQMRRETEEMDYLVRMENERDDSREIS